MTTDRSRDREGAGHTLRASYAGVLALGLAALALSGCPSIVVPGDIGESPRVWVESMREAVRTDNVNNFYYLLTHDVRQQYGLWAVDHAWTEVKQQLRLDPDTTELVEVEYLAESPFPPAPAARVRLRYDYTEGGEVEEDFLLLLQIDEPWAGDEGGDDVGERWPQWRAQYPYAPYQRHATWFKDVESAGSASGAGDPSPSREDPGGATVPAASKAQGQAGETPSPQSPSRTTEEAGP